MRTTDELRRDATPFADSVIDTLPGRGDRFVTWNQYAQRVLLDHGGHRYSVTNMVMSPKGGVAVSVRLQFADDEWYDAVGEGDTPTAAESNAYKRACAHAGIGLHLYCDDEDEKNQYWLIGTMMAQNGNSEQQAEVEVSE